MIEFRKAITFLINLQLLFWYSSLGDMQVLLRLFFYIRSGQNFDTLPVRSANLFGYRRRSRLLRNNYSPQKLTKYRYIERMFLFRYEDWISFYSFRPRRSRTAHLPSKLWLRSWSTWSIANAKSWKYWERDLWLLHICPKCSNSR